MHRNNLPALVKDIQECQKIQEILAQRKETQAEMRRLDPALALRQDKLAHVFEDVLNIKRRQHKKCVRKQNKDTAAAGLHDDDGSLPPWQPALELPTELTSSTAQVKPQHKWHEADDDSSSDSASSYYSDDNEEPEVSAHNASIKAQDTLADVQCLQELLMPRHQLDADTRALQDEIGCPGHYSDPDFLHKCLPSCYPRGVDQDKLDRAIPFVKGEETLSPSIFLLTSTNPKTQMQFTQTHANLVASGMTVIPLLGIDGERVPAMRRNAWRRAFVSWGHRGFPQAKKHISASTMKLPSTTSGKPLW